MIANDRFDLTNQQAHRCSPTAIVDCGCLKAQQRGQRVRKFRGVRKSRALDEQGEDCASTLEQRFYLAANDIVLLVQPRGLPLGSRYEPGPADDDHARLARRQRASD